MKILGIHDSHDCGAAVIEDGKIIAAVNEERINREKMCWGFPKQSIQAVLKIAKIEAKDIDIVAVATIFGTLKPEIVSHKDASALVEGKSTKKLVSKLSGFSGAILSSEKWIPFQRAIEKAGTKGRRTRTKKEIKKIGFECPVKFVDHHTAHAAGAYYTSGKENATIVTNDASGDSISSLVCIGEKGEMKTAFRLGSYNSIGKYYAYVTELCGFTPNKHEGKITGLAAYGKPAYLDYFNSLVRYNNGRIVNYSKSRHDSAKLKLKEGIGNFDNKNLAASIQDHLEENLVKYVDYWVEKTGIRDVVTAGGVFANVKLNQRIAESPKVNSFFVHPHMGDGGLAVGAALYLFAEHKLNQGSFLKPKELDNIYFGPGFSKEEISKALEKHKLKAREVNDIETETAQAISEKKIVGHFQGRMEYGPRALGNRSIIADPTDKNINNWLNKRLHRTEFMPFAPSILDTDAKAFYKNYEQSAYAARFMTITFDVPEAKAKLAPAVVHVDDTARPQVVDTRANPRYHKVLKAYKDITGLPLFINTSFNAHEEPIVCTPDDAIRSFKNGAVDVLVLGNFIVDKK